MMTANYLRISTQDIKYYHEIMSGIKGNQRQTDKNDNKKSISKEEDITCLLSLCIDEERK